MEGPVARQAVVIGGSFAGLLAARVLSAHFSRILVLERDPIADRPEARKGQPQARHLHGLLLGGQHILSALFPGLGQELLALGATPVDLGADVRWYQFGGYKMPYPSGLHSLLVSRPCLEWRVRRRVAALPNVELRGQVSVEGLTAGPNATGVTGVEIVDRAHDSRRATLEADLVVDASGRGSASSHWLAALGYAPAPEMAVRVDMRYATRFYRRLPGDLPGASLLMIYPQPPKERRGGLAVPAEPEPRPGPAGGPAGGRWIVALVGWLGEQPPADAEGFLAYAKGLPAQDIYRLMHEAEPLSDIITYRYPSSVWRRYDRLAAFPAGYLVLGDALASFNPVYGQGIASAARQAALLARLLDKPGDPRGLWRRYFAGAARLVALPWRMAVGEDCRFAGEASGARIEGEAPPGTRLINAYVARVYRASQHDPLVYDAFLRVVNLAAPPATLFHPAILRRALWPRRPA